MEEKGAIYREKNPVDGRGVLIKLTAFGIEKRKVSREHVIQFNETVKKHISEVKIKNFFEVTQTINKLINSKNIFDNDLKNKKA
jgi:DNA-binding MarR family transcriptional regulator